MTLAILHSAVASFFQMFYCFGGFFCLFFFLREKDQIKHQLQHIIMLKVMKNPKSRNSCPTSSFCLSMDIEDIFLDSFVCYDHHTDMDEHILCSGSCYTVEILKDHGGHKGPSVILEKGLNADVLVSRECSRVKFTTLPCT